MGLQAESRRGKSEHPSELSAAENADGSARPDGRCQLLDLAHLSDGASATASVSLARHLARRLAMALSESARMAAAWSAAFFAPLSPIAKVATGIPPGIWT